jgi:hypothetical protein
MLEIKNIISFFAIKASLEGKVIGRDGEKVKLHLSIDDNQSKDEASWFGFAPPTGNMMYCMPVVGTSTRPLGIFKKITSPSSG